MRNTLFTLAFLLAAVAAGPATATVIVVPAELDLETVEPTTVVMRSVWLINTGDDPVQLLSARGSCGCTVLEFKPQTLASQAALQVPVRVTAPKTAGRRKTVTVTFTVRDQEPIKLPIRLVTTGDFPTTTDVRAEPAVVDLGAVTAGNLVSASARLVNTSDIPQRITAARPACKCMTLPDFEPVTLAAGEVIDVHIQVEVPRTLGASSREITFVLEGRQVVKVPVRMKSIDTRVEALQRHLGDLYQSRYTFDGFRIDGDVITAIAWEGLGRQPRAMVTCHFNDDGTVRSSLIEPISS
ncbi:MAG: DUF1573 domain-containing protein [Planctomycetota bacterium]|nr:MAG: DUF1573 domain-containing protein [Planctomycetota bacterium]